jgi:hypothetical protein
MSDTCITYYTEFTQNDPPVRKQNQYNALTTTSSTRPCDTWICNDSANEHECLGIKYVLDGNGNVTVGSRYMTIDEWKNAWKTQNCPALFSSMTQGLGTTNNSSFSQLGFQYVQEDFAFMFSRYFNQDANTTLTTINTTQGIKRISGKQSNIPLVSPIIAPAYPFIYANTWIGGKYNLTTKGSQGYDPFLTTLLDACKSVPGACNLAQLSMCSKCSRSDILADTAINTFCGCFAPNSEGSDFYNETLKNYDPTCDPICNKGFTIKNVDPTTGLLKQCNANVCVIDNVTISTLDTQGASPTFTQVCPACADGSGNCVCIINTTFENTITGILGSDGTAINTVAKFTQVCPNAQCYVNNALTGELEEVPCENSLNKKLLERSGLFGQPIKFPVWTLLMFGVLLLVAILVVFAYKYQSENIKVYEYVPGTKYKSV